MRIGYLLKKARDTDILQNSPYNDYLDFAEGEFGLDKTQVSRFIRINDRFSVDGNSENLMDKYKGFGSTKLTLMLALPDALNEELTPDYSKSDIQTIKEEVEEEKKVTPLEVMTEEVSCDIAKLSLLGKVMYRIGEAEPELMADMLEIACLQPNPDDKYIVEQMAPAGQKIYMARVPGVGRVVLNIKEDRISLINVHDNSKQKYEAEDIGKALLEIVDAAWSEEEAYPDKSKEMWSHIYGVPYPEKVKEVPQRKESRVAVAKEEKKEEKPEKKIKYKKPEILPGPPKREEKGTQEEKEGTPAAEKETSETEKGTPKAEKGTPATGKGTTAAEEAAAEETTEEVDTAAAPTACQPGKAVEVWEEKTSGMCSNKDSETEANIKRAIAVDGSPSHVKNIDFFGIKKLCLPVAVDIAEDIIRYFYAEKKEDMKEVAVPMDETDMQVLCTLIHHARREE